MNCPWRYCGTCLTLQKRRAQIVHQCACPQLMATISNYIWYCTPPLIWIDLILKPLRSNKFCLMGALPEPQKSLKRVSWVKAVDLDFSSIWQAILRTWKEADLRRDDFQQAAGHFGYIRVIREDLMHSNSLKLVFPILAMFYPNHHPECYLLFRTSCLFSSV